MKRTRIAALLLALALCLGLLPVAAMAEEAEEEFDITFIAAPGKLSDGTESVIIRTTSGDAASTKHLVQLPADPHRDGYVFGGWFVSSPNENPSVANRNFEADTTVQAYWTPSSTTYVLLLNPNGGDLPAGTDKTIMLNMTDHTAPTLDEKLPTPTRPGYRFDGWYKDGTTVPVKVGDVFGDRETTLTAQWTAVRTSKIDPSLKVICDDSSSKIEAGAKTVKVYLSCATNGAALDWRPLERVLFMGGTPSDVEAAAKSYISGNFSAVGLKLTDVKYEHDIPVNDSAYPYELYPEGVYPTTGLTLTLEGEAKAGTLNITLAPGIFVQLVGKGETETLTEASADIFKAAKVSIPVASANPDGPFTVKFDLNCKNPKKDEIPKDQTIVKGNAVSLPDGKKLTPPAANLEFYAWCLLADNGQLYPWKASTAVVSDMTLYAGWVKKGTVIKDGEAIPDASQPAETTKPTETPKPEETTKPAAPVFTDVAATSPFAPAISWAVEKKITNGKTAATFGPGDPCTRAQIVTFLWRAAGSPEPKLTETQYMDVTDPNAYYYKAVQWAAEKEMEYAGTFDPHKTCDRASAVYFIWKAFGSSKAAAKSSFADMPETPKTGGQWYWPDLLDAVDWAVGQGVTTGKTATTFAPGDPCTRGQIVTFLYRAYVK